LRQNAYSDMGRGSFAMPVQTNALQSLHELPKPLEQLSVDELRRKREISEVSTRTLRCLTEQFTMFGFEWELPVIFSKSTDPLWPDPGASIEKRIEVDVYDENVRTTLSMIVHKLVACSLLHPKLFILSPNVRIEKRERKSTGWHAYEFTQLDFEARSASSRDIMQLCEIILRAVVEDLNANCGQTLNSLRGGKLEVQTTPFEVYDREELVAKYGEQWESRLPLEIHNPAWVTDIPREFYDYQDLKTQKWDNYDLYLPGYGEVLSGSKREWEYEKILTKMQRDGVTKENYALLLRLAQERRLEPSAGAGIGIERLVSWIVGARHIGEVQTFPKIPGIVYDL
jgi:asparaginyl-tRNA synthetase